MMSYFEVSMPYSRYPQHWYTNQENAEAYDRQTFDADVSEYRAEFLKRLPARMWPCEHEPHKVFDLGCGGGRDVLAFHQAGCRVAGIEYSIALAELARSRNLHVLCNEMEDELRRAVALETTVHGVWAMASLLWIQTEQALQTVIEHIATVLVDRGVFFLSVPYSEETMVGRDRGKDIPIWLYSYSTWRRVLESAGFVIEQESLSTATTSDKQWLNIWAIRYEELV